MQSSQSIVRVDTLEQASRLVELVEIIAWITFNVPWPDEASTVLFVGRS